MKILALGPKGTNGHEAATIAQRMLLSRYPEENVASIEFCDNNTEILAAAACEQCFAVAPVENSTAGLVADVVKEYWLRQKSQPPLRVIGEITLPIEHTLLVHPDVEEIAEVMSHPQALAQCKQSLALRGFTGKPVKSTALAAEMVATDPACRNLGAIASEFAGKTYGLKVLQGHMEDNPDNTTRFHVLGPDPVLPTGRDRTAVMFKTKDVPRALLNPLWAIGAIGDANMSSIHSIPLGIEGQYAFYCEFDCHLDSPKGIELFSVLRPVVEWLIVLGSYPQGTKPGKGGSNGS